jgi:hypothetical protein
MRMTRLAATPVAVALTAGCGVHVGVEDDKETSAQPRVVAGVAKR